MTARPMDINNGKAAFIIRFLEKRAKYDPALGAILLEALLAANADADADARRCEICGEVIVVEPRWSGQRRTATRNWTHRAELEYLDHRGNWADQKAGRPAILGPEHDPEPLRAIPGVDYVSDV